MNIALLEKLPDNFVKKCKSYGLNVYDFSQYFKEYKTIYNYLQFSRDKKIDSIKKIKERIKNEFTLDGSKLKEHYLDVNDNLEKLFNKIDIVIFRTRLIVDSMLIDLFKNVKLFIRSGSGFENIDFKYCFSKNILFQNIPDANTISAFEHTLTLILGAIKKVVQFDNSIRNSNWRNDYSYNTELKNKNIMVFGYGRVGSNVSKALAFLGANVFVYDPFIKIQNEIKKNEIEILNNKFLNKIRFLPFKNLNDFDDEYKTKMDIITLHLPLWDKTEKMINSKFLKGFKKNVIIINTARGEIVDENDIYNLLKNNEIGFYASDVFCKEPVFKNKLFSLENKTLFTPHIGAYTKEAKQKLVDLTIEAIKYFKETGKCKYIIDRRFYFSKYYK